MRNTCDWQMRTSPCESSARRNGSHSGHIVERCEKIGEMIRQTTRLFFKPMRSPKTYLQIPVNLLIGLAAISHGGPPSARASEFHFAPYNWCCHACIGVWVLGGSLGAPGRFIVRKSPSAVRGPRIGHLCICPSSSLVWLCPMKIDQPAPEIKQLLGFVSQKSLAPPAQIDVERRRHVFAFALPLQTL
jgi:hypothetical protein